MIRKDNTDLSLTRHFKLLKIRRPSIYYTPVGFDQATIDLMHEIGRIFTSTRSLAAARSRRICPNQGSRQAGHRVRRLMSIMGLQAIYKGPNTSKMHPQYKDLAILIKKAVDHARTSCLVQRYYLHSVKNGFLYPAAIMDWATRKVLS